MPQRIGIFGGTFDPPHVAHLVVAEQVKEQLGLDEIWFMVAHHPWQKQGSRVISSAEDRFGLTALAIGDAEGFVVTRHELDRGGDSYTIDTLEQLAAASDDEFWVVIGGDSADGLQTWHRAEDLRSLARFAVVNRPGHEGELPAGWDGAVVEIPALDVSSTDLRSMVADGRSIRFLTPDAVVQRVGELGLYRPTS